MRMATYRSRHEMCQRVIVENKSLEEVVHMQVGTIGLDIAKNMFQTHGVDAAGEMVIIRQLRRGQVIGYFGGCRPALSAWRPARGARELMKLGIPCG